MLCILGVLVYFSVFNHEYVLVKCPDCEGTGIIKCANPACDHGMVPCPNQCLKKDDPGWTHMQVAGHPDTDVWMQFNSPNGGWCAYNQNHIGHVISLVNGSWVDTGVCPVCNGTGKVVCPVCHGKIKVCPTCHGSGTVKKEVS